MYIYINLHMPKYLKLDFMLKQYIYSKIMTNRL